MSMVYGHNKGVIPLEFDLSPAIGLDLLLLVGDVLLLTKVRRVRNSPIPIEQQCLEKLVALVSVNIFHKMLEFSTRRIHNFLRNLTPKLVCNLTCQYEIFEFI